MNILSPDSIVRLDLGEAQLRYQDRRRSPGTRRIADPPADQGAASVGGGGREGADLHHADLAASLDAAGISHHLYRVPSGEGSKSFARLNICCRQCSIRARNDLLPCWLSAAAWWAI